MGIIQQGADQYVKAHTTGNSYIDERLRNAYMAGATEAVDSLVRSVKLNMTPYHQRLVEVKAERMKVV